MDETRWVTHDNEGCAKMEGCHENTRDAMEDARMMGEIHEMRCPKEEDTCTQEGNPKGEGSCTHVNTRKMGEYTP